MNKYDNLLKEVFSDERYKVNNINKLLNLGYILRTYDENNNEIFLRETKIEEDNENEETRNMFGTVKSSSQLWTPFTMSRCLFIQ